jgi:ABC-2 type transport system permease protein
VSRWSAIEQLTRVRLRLFFREPGALFWTFGFPIVMSIVLGIAFRNRPPEPVFVAIEAGPKADRANAILSGAKDVVVKVLPPDEAAAALRTGKVTLVVSGDGDGYAYRFDPTRPESRLARVVTDDALQRGEGRREAFQSNSKQITEPGSRYIDFLIPGLVGLGLMSSGLWGIGFALVDMRVKKLLRRLMATPMRRSDFLFSFVLVRALLLVFEVPPILLFGRFVFDVAVTGSLATVALIVLCGGLTFAAIGLLIASRAQTTQTVSGLINLVSFPMFLCSGVFFSASRFPDVVQPFIRLLPLTALNDALRDVMIEGASLAQIGSKLGIVLAWGLGAFALAVRLFRWR